MIQSNELRLGNLVMYDERIFKIESLTKSYPFLNTPEFGHGVVEYANLNPIPLTEEWLIKFGFIFRKDDDDEHGFYSSSLLVLENLYPKGIWSICVQGSEWEWTFIAKFKSIHQLQNIYFAITGEELITNGLDDLKKSDN